MRPSRDEWGLKLVQDVALRATCVRRAVGAVLMNSRGQILATGYNGVAAGLPHCNEGYPCEGADAPSGTNLDACEAVHAEQNALLQCRDIYDIETCYVTVSPCVTCTKLLMNTSCTRIVFLEEYTQSVTPEGLWRKDCNRRWVKGDA